MYNDYDGIQHDYTRKYGLAREFVVALPVELSRKSQVTFLRDFIQKNFVDLGIRADFAIHDTGGHNPHAHILLTVRYYQIIICSTPVHRRHIPCPVPPNGSVPLVLLQRQV